uniref:Anamorsin homolog n=1 Tax=Pyramimonas obovata TaxID=1411642 RepID=A0A6T7W491_9CHLO|mmetsp:Transcript_21726/g.47714  ORF Transcript_21726/g.47714 Transcript_21726/m.47714 type:complete len:272 (+) Transcript_21726:128-943(+)|eukprot:CAMPEP_0118924854 /NCGR_PEP_ID=MMETSP1169-20130426/2795_1 /TAXON_ID=36882 /ORGANISM="Pyramimonas obovata, Strain CCMP722" /LENGTH=271 /DNA_ID=CAMNT_0006865993 /DNA_START=141 /DNA_END=956 /DNA_ORIENTATION=+
MAVSQCLIITPAVELSLSTIQTAIQEFQLDAQNTAVITQGTYDPTERGVFSQCKAGAYQKVVSVVNSKEAFFHSEHILKAMISMLSPGGTLYLQSMEADCTFDQLSRNLVLTGYVDPVQVTTRSSSVVKANKPSWEAGAKFSLKRTPQSQPAAAPVKLNPWATAMDDDDVVDENALLAGEMLAPVKVPDDCEVGEGGARKACKNCTCGRAEGEMKEKVELTQEMLDNPQSQGGCGNCSLGDAFRCSTCPYAGLPAFKMGEKIQLDTMAADI